MYLGRRGVLGVNALDLSISSNKKASAKPIALAFLFMSHSRVFVFFGECNLSAVRRTFSGQILPVSSF